MPIRPVTLLSFALLAALLAWLAATPAAQGQDKLEFRDGDRVVLLGGAFVERLQIHGNLEFLLTAGQPAKNLTFRNLGWSGDTVFGQSRAVFGSQAEGFARLKKDVSEARPTLILVAYGANEANDGESGLANFKEGLTTLLEMLSGTGARLAILSPVKRENLGRPLPDPSAYNESVRLYSDVLRETAAKRKIPYVDLSSIMGGPSDSAEPITSALDQLTDNGLHLSSYGDWRAAPKLAEQLGVPTPKWSVDLDISARRFEASGVAIVDVGPTPKGFKFTAKDEMLPLPGPPADAPAKAASLALPRTLRVRGLARGTYEIRVDGKPIAKVEHDKLAAGLQLSQGPEFDQALELRGVIEDKNVLYFHRYRPQNETYLFLFRKHEQGNNAVEIPQFDPLIAAHERQIADLRKPQPHVYEIVAE